MKQRVSLIWAMARNRVIGKDNWLPWDLPDELAYFRNTTAGKPVVMGRRTYESVNRPMPGRLNIVLSRRGFSADGVTVVGTMEEALAVAAGDPADECFVIGGADVYVAAFPHADRLHATFIDAEIEGDTFFPPFDFKGWTVVASEHHPVDARHAYAYEIRVYEREK